MEIGFLSCLSVMSLCLVSLSCLCLVSLSCLLSLDISAAFDILPHQLLLNRALKINSAFQTMSLIASFLSDRSSYVSIDIHGKHSSSNLTTATCGVPQGSTLGPIFFSMYVAPLEQL